MRVEGADFGYTADIQRHHQPVASYSSGDDAGALRQHKIDSVDNGASLGAEKTIAEGDQNRRDGKRRGKARYQHHAPHPRQKCGLLLCRFGRNGFGHAGLSIICAYSVGKTAIQFLRNTRREQGSSLQHGSSSNGGQRLQVTVAGNEGSTRLDRVLALHVAELSRSRLKALILAGQVSLKGAPIRDPAYHVAAGDTITIEVPEAAAAEPAGEDIALDIVYEDDDIIVIDKPKGLVVHPAAGHETGTLVNALIAHCGASLSGIGGVKRPGIVHRLDKDTTGLMVVAKNDRAHKSLTGQFADHGRTGAMRRGYMAFVWGVPSRQRGTVDAPIDRHPYAREKMAVREGGREAITHWEGQEIFKCRDGKPGAGLLGCQLETRRTHQIRVHLAHIGHPLLGDGVYGPHFKTKASHLGPASQKALAASGPKALKPNLLPRDNPGKGPVLEWFRD